MSVYHHAKLERCFAIVFYTKMAVSSREWKPRVRQLKQAICWEKDPWQEKYRKKEWETERREKWETWTERKVYVTDNNNNFVPLLLNHKLKYLFTSISKWSCQHERLIPRTITKLGDFYHLMISFGEVRFVKFGIFQSGRNSESRHMNCCKVDIDLKTELFKPRLWVNCVSICTVVGMWQPQTNMLRPKWCRGSL